MALNNQQFKSLGLSLIGLLMLLSNYNFAQENISTSYQDVNSSDYKIQILIGDGFLEANTETEGYSITHSMIHPKIDGTVTGVEQLPIYKVTAFPNPFRNHIRVTGDVQFQTYEILSVDGSLVKCGNLNQNTIDTSDIDDGIYILRLYSRQSSIPITRKVFKLK